MGKIAKKTKPSTTPEVRQSIFKMVLIAPAFLLLGQAVQSKPNYVDYDRLVSNSEVNGRITNYIDVVRMTEPVIRGQNRDIEKARIAADKWAAGAAAGKLLALPSQGVDDNSQTGVKAQILNASRGLALMLRNAGLKEAKEGDYDQAAKDFCAAMQVNAPLRYSDLATVALVGNRERRLLQDLKGIWSEVSDGQKAKAKEVLESIKPDQRQFEQVTRTQRRLAVVAQIKNEEVARAEGMPVKDGNKGSNLGVLYGVATSNEKDSRDAIAYFTGETQ